MDPEDDDQPYQETRVMLSQPYENVLAASRCVLLAGATHRRRQPAVLGRHKVGPYMIQRSGKT